MVVNLGHFDIHHPTADQLGLVSNFLLDAVRPGDLRDSLLLQEGDEAQRTMNVVYAVRLLYVWHTAAYTHATC
jgi:hypothetical protein